MASHNRGTRWQGQPDMRVTWRILPAAGWRPGAPHLAGRVRGGLLAAVPLVAVSGPGTSTVDVGLGGCLRVLGYETKAGGPTGPSIGQATPGAVATIESVTHPRP